MEGNFMKEIVGIETLEPLPAPIGPLVFAQIWPQVSQARTSVPIVGFVWNKAFLSKVW